MARYRFRVLFAFCCLLSINVSADAQSSRGKPSPENTRNRAIEKSKAEDDAARLNEDRLAFAVQIVSSLADEARSYKDESLRVKVQARAADVLWDVDQERARTLFDRAWDVAQTIDKEGQQRNEEARRRFLSGQGGPGFIPPPPNLRAEVLRLASLHDRTLAEGYFAKMEEENKRDEEQNKEARHWDPTQPPEAVAKRLQLARQLLENGETEKALLFAEPALNQVTSHGIIFLVLLRQKNTALADQIFSSLLERTVSDPIADATSVSLLSSYVFTPSVLVTSTRNGLLMNPWTSTRPPPQLTPALRTRFFGVASQVLLRPLSPPELEITSAGVAGTYFTIQRLLPLFEQNAPELAAALQGRLNTLAQGRDEIIPEQQRDFVKAGFGSNEKKEEGPDDTLARIERASSTAERDHLYAIAARNAVTKSDPKARELADKIEDADLKKSVREFVDFLMISQALEKKDTEKALRLTRAGELSHIQRVWSYTKIAVLLKSSAPERATDLISEAMSEAGRMEVTSAESAEAWVAIAASAGEVDQARKWETVLDAARAINRAENYTGEEGSVSVGFQTKDSVVKTSIAAPSINLAGLFGMLAKADAYRAADMATSIKNESPRAVALLAVGRSVFDSKLTKKKL
jgi:hypothetical protein